MKIKNRFIGFLVGYFVGLGGFSALISLLNAIIGVPKFEQALTSATISFLPVAAVTVLLLREGLDSFELWARRIINALFSMSCITLSFWAFSVFKSPSDVAFAFLLGLAGNLFVSVPLFIIADRRRKKKLEEINKKLKENSENTQT